MLEHAAAISQMGYVADLARVKLRGWSMTDSRRTWEDAPGAANPTARSVESSNIYHKSGGAVRQWATADARLPSQVFGYCKMGTGPLASCERSVRE